MQTQFDSVTPQEKKMALLAHSSILLTFIIGVTTTGLAIFAAVLVPFVIWLLYRNRSDYVAFHALQATIYQLGTILLFGVLALSLTVALLFVWLVVAVLSFFLVGLILIPFAVLLTIIISITLAIIPLVSLGYGLVASWEVYNRSHFRYQWVADWLEGKYENPLKTYMV